MERTYHVHMFRERLRIVVQKHVLQPGTPERGAGGSKRPSCLSVGEQGEQSALFKCNDLFSNC